MGKSVPYVFRAVSLVFFLFLVGLTGYRIDSARRASASAAVTSADALRDQADAFRKAGGFDSSFFQQKMRDVFFSQPRLLALTIHSQADGILYVISRSKTYIAAPSEVTPDWRGTPEYRYSSGYEELLSRSFPAPDQAITMDALFVLFGREDLFPILRDDLYLILGFLILCGIFILIASSMPQDRLSEGARAAAQGPASTPPYAPAAPAAAPVEPPPYIPQAWEMPAAAEPVVPATPVSPPAPAAPAYPAPAAEHAHAAAPSAPAAGPRQLTSPESGLVWAEHLEPRLKAEISRAASSDMDLSMALIELDVPTTDHALPALYKGAAKVVLESYPIHDLLFENGRASIAAIMPDMDIDQAVSLMEDVRKKIAASSFDGRPITVSIGVSARGGRLIDGPALREEASISVRKASREGGNRVIGFRVDPTKYRETL